MPNAATFDDDVRREAVPRRPAPRKPRATGAAGKGKRGAKRPPFAMHRMARFAAIGMAATMATGIMVNALVLQKGHHPAPLFGKTMAPLAKAAAAAPAPKTVQTDAPAPEAKATIKPHRTLAADRGDDASSPDDAIGRLLAGGTPTAPAKTKAESDSKMVSGVQRALAKLGFKVPATGTSGPATRKAIEAFEKDRHMPIKGEITHRLAKALAVETGIKID